VDALIKNLYILARNYRAAPSMQFPMRCQKFPILH